MLQDLQKRSTVASLSASGAKVSSLLKNHRTSARQECPTHFLQ